MIDELLREIRWIDRLAGGYAIVEMDLAANGIEHESAERDFYDGFTEIQNGRWCLDHYPLHDLVVYSPTSAYEQLLHGILPALVRACRETTILVEGAGRPGSGRRA